MSSPAVFFSPHAIEAIAHGLLIVAIKHVREDNGLSLQEAKTAVDAYAAGHRSFVTTKAPRKPAPTDAAEVPAAGDPTQLDRFLAEDRIIEAIKLVHETTGLGLKEAKDWVDARRADSTLDLPTPRAVVSTNCVTPALPTAHHDETVTAPETDTSVRPVKAPASAGIVVRDPRRGWIGLVFLGLLAVGGVLWWLSR